MLPEEITELFEYGTVDQVIDECMSEFGLRDYHRAALRMEIELVLFLFFTRAGLSERLRDSLEIEEIRANLIAQKLNDDLFIIVDGLLTFVEQQFSGTRDEMPPVVLTPEVATTDSAAGPIETPPAPRPAEQPPADSETSPNTPQTKDTELKPLRTFAMDVDMSRVHGYGAYKSGEAEADGDDTPVHRSSQDDIMKK